jgi:hypothetical protein
MIPDQKPKRRNKGPKSRSYINQGNKISQMTHGKQERKGSFDVKIIKAGMRHKVPLYTSMRVRPNGSTSAGLANTPCRSTPRKGQEYGSSTNNNLLHNIKDARLYAPQQQFAMMGTR